MESSGVVSDIEIVSTDPFDPEYKIDGLTFTCFYEAKAYSEGNHPELDGPMDDDWIHAAYYNQYPKKEGNAHGS